MIGQGGNQNQKNDTFWKYSKLNLTHVETQLLRYYKQKLYVKNIHFQISYRLFEYINASI